MNSTASLKAVSKIVNRANCVFSNKKVYKELQIECPLLCAAMSSACNLENKVKEEQKLFELQANPS